MKNHIIFILFICYIQTIFAQKDALWVIGDTTNTQYPYPCCAYEMHFVGDTFELVSVVRNYSAVAFLTSVDGAGATSSNICTDSGSLLLHTDGYIIRNAQGDTIQNSNLQMSVAMSNPTINGQLSVAYRSMYFLPHPQKENYYFLIYPYQGENINPNIERLNLGLICAEIDVNANNGRGKVLSHQQFSQDTLRQLSVGVVRHANGRDWWVLSPDYKKNKYYRFLIGPQGIHNYLPQTIGNAPIYDPNRRQGSGYFSKDGSLFVIDSPDNYRIMNFDRCTGLLSNYREIQGLNYGCPTGQWYIVASALSPNNRFLYVADISAAGPNCAFDSVAYNRLYQYDLWDTNPAANPIVLMQFDPLEGLIGAPFLSPNGYIMLNYDLFTTSGTINFVKKPNEKGGLSEPTKIPYGRDGIWRYNQTVNYSLGPLIGSACDTLAHTGIAPMRDEAGVEVYPNPTQDKLHIHLSTLTEAGIVLYNVLGEEVYTGTSNDKETELSLAALPQGLYFLIVKTKENRIFTEKVIKQ